MGHSKSQSIMIYAFDFRGLIEDRYCISANKSSTSHSLQHLRKCGSFQGLCDVPGFIMASWWAHPRDSFHLITWCLFLNFRDPLRFPYSQPEFPIWPFTKLLKEQQARLIEIAHRIVLVDFNISFLCCLSSTSSISRSPKQFLKLLERYICRVICHLNMHFTTELL